MVAVPCLYYGVMVAFKIGIVAVVSAKACKTVFIGQWHGAEDVVVIAVVAVPNKAVSLDVGIK